LRDGERGGAIRLALADEAMKRSMTIVAVLAVVSAWAAARAEPVNVGPELASDRPVQLGLDLTQAQRRRVFESIDHSGVVAPKGFEARVGTTVPPEIELRPLPADIATAIPALQAYRYAKVDLKVLLVDRDRRLVEIVENPLL
jgi:hypothetical protein